MNDVLLTDSASQKIRGKMCPYEKPPSSPYTRFYQNTYLEGNNGFEDIVYRDKVRNSMIIFPTLMWVL